MTKLCDECETVAHCSKHGCIPKRDFWKDYEPEPTRPAPMTKDKALDLALEALEAIIHWYGVRDKNDVMMPPLNQNPEIKESMDAITAIKQARALDKKAENARELGLDYEPAQQEPVAWICEGSSSDEKHAIDYWPGDVDDLPIGTQLYTQAQRAWVGLSDAEIHNMTILMGFNPEWVAEVEVVKSIVRNLEVKLKEKNNG